MDYMEAIRARRSVRAFGEGDIPAESLEVILDAGRLAPTGGNIQPWEFIVMKDKDRIDALIDTTFVGFDPNSIHKQKWMASAPVLIVVCTNYKASCARYGETKGRELAFMDACAATENMLIAASGLGLGACWVSGFHSDKLAKLLKLPDMIEPISIIPVGHVTRQPKSPVKFSLGEITHYEEYGNQEP